MTTISFLVTHPHLASQWHPTKNTNFDPNVLSAGSNFKTWWMCDRGHEFEQIIASRCIGRGCKYCSGNAVLAGFNDLSTANPKLASEWHPTKNGDLTPINVTAGSNRKVWWLCKKGHEWKTTTNNRNNLKRGCVYCAGQKAIAGVNDLATLKPELAKEWHPTRNSAPVADFMAGSSRKVWWLGKDCGHEWEAVISNRVRKNYGCPVCSYRQVLKGFNDLQTLNTKITSEWHPTKNGDLTPSMVTPGSDRKVWWQCELGHEWETFVYARAKNGCFKCSALSAISKGEQELFDFLTNLGLIVEQSNRTVLDNGFELDLFIPSKNFAVEFNGVYWHTEEQGKHNQYHYTKWEQCKNKGIQLIQVWEDDYIRNPELVKRMLAHKMGVATEPKVFARKTKIKSLSQDEVNIFLDQNHIQGTVDGSIRLGLTVVDTQTGVENAKPLERLVAVIVLKKEPGSEGKTFNLLRFATSQPVVGGFTKLLKQAENLEGVEKIITFSDNAVSDGGLYESTGFIADKTLAPDYMYVVERVRVHKFNYRLKRFHDDPELQYVDGLTERELAKLNGLSRVWDAGKTRWSKRVKSLS